MKRIITLSGISVLLWLIFMDSALCASAKGAPAFTVPVSPQPLSPANNSVNLPVSVNLSWSDSFGAAIYEVVLAYDSQFNNVVIDTNILSTSATINNLKNNTTYYWRVSAWDSSGASPWSDTWNFSTIQTAPGIPRLSSPSSGATNQPVTLNLNWQSTPGAVSYRLQLSTDTLFNYITYDASDIKDTYLQVKNLENSRKYFWRVRASNPGGNSAWSEIWRFTTIVATPGAPALIAPAMGAVNQPIDVTLSWNALYGAYAYRLQVSADTTFSYLIYNSDTIKTNSMQFKTLQNGRKYFWRVYAWNAGGVSPWSEVRVFTVILSQPSLSSPLNSSVNQPLNVTLKWKRMTFADSYHLQVSTFPSFSSLIYEEYAISDTSRQIPHLNNNTVYYWRLRGRNAGSYGPNSDTWNFTTIKAIPAIPVLASPADGSAFQPVNVTLVWNSVQGAMTYRLQLASDAIFGNILLDDSTITATSKLVTNLYYGTRYYWRINARNAAGTSAFSNSCSFVTLLPPPENLAAIPYGIKKVKLTWTDKSEGETGFIIERKLEGDFSAIDTAEANSTGFIDSTVLGGVLYTYRIRGFNMNTPSQYSNQAEVTTITSVKRDNAVPTEYSLFQNHPNPFNPSTTLSYALPLESNVKLTVYNSIGQVVAEIINEIQAPGTYHLSFQASDLPSGLYFYSIIAQPTQQGTQEFRKVRKMMLIK